MPSSKVAQLPRFKSESHPCALTQVAFKLSQAFGDGKILSLDEYSAKEDKILPSQHFFSKSIWYIRVQPKTFFWLSNDLKFYW